MARVILLVILGTLVGCAASSPVSMSPRHGGIARLGGDSAVDATSRVDRLAARMAALTDRPIRVNVVGRDELLAFSWPGGQIYLTRGLVRVCSDEEISAVIGHEMGHMLQDGHLHSTLSLTGQPHPDREATADAISVRLLNAAGIPASSMRTALCKVSAAQSSRDVRTALAARIALLP